MNLTDFIRRQIGDACSPVAKFGLGRFMQLALRRCWRSVDFCRPAPDGFSPAASTSEPARHVGFFQLSGLITEFRWRNQGTGPRQGKSQGSHLRFPMACLINSSSGTCTEIVAACLQDHQRARIVGERTAGKASLQGYFPVQRGTMRITTSHAYRPAGNPLDRTMALADQPDAWGVTPDSGCTVDLPQAERDNLREHLAGLQIILPPDSQKKVIRESGESSIEKALEYLREKSMAE